jgi:hypothetical protein
VIIHSYLRNKNKNISGKMKAELEQGENGARKTNSKATLVA